MVANGANWTIVGNGVELLGRYSPISGYTYLHGAMGDKL
jgi:hypothetical protein